MASFWMDGQVEADASSWHDEIQIYIEISKRRSSSSLLPAQLWLFELCL
jgi:hypothetical protein